ncbi:His/Glu/Gln/Arg/opine family amino acid ABC transporter permease subunit [Rhodovulum bhavnagarense]|uniref:His/Glu/Gln/Arg/opine family amino acid ABC transporter permease subunit n=1 Tax=Rhodovulum bhavnagarense TaxID=992286 RepID=A0A4R2RAS9_9RHOB|nr:ABC transporter permease subunit [Rhodovulum bhavnagarense]TCP60402.1 His/Glu/Gln/Arg/opine family amino acid ABC transporter permease subunit [Rhodovulum bhavnagarense]
MSNLSYVRTEMLGEQSPPGTAIGIVGWLRANLFSNWLNTILTLVSLVFIYQVFAAILPWLIHSSWTANSLQECRAQVDAAYGMAAEGGCWAVIRERYLQLVFGFYPSELYWRPILAFGLTLVALAPILFTALPRKMLWLSPFAPFVVPWLLWGGTVWVPLLVVAGLGLAYVVTRVLSSHVSGLLAVPVAALVAILWWLYAVMPVNDAVTAMIANQRIPDVSADMRDKVEILPGEIAALDAQIAALGQTVGRAEAEKDALVSALEAAETEAARTAVLSAIHELRGPRDALAALEKQRLVRNEELSRARTLLAGLEALPENRTTRETLLAQLANATGAARGDLEARLATVDNRIASVVKEVGRVGLIPVESRRFGGFMLSITIGLVAITASLPIGVMLALGRQSDLLILRAICVGFIEFIRGVPLITLLFVASVLLNYFLPPGTSFDIILRVMIMVTLFASAYMAEVIRGGLAALPKGQYEAADALGLDYWKAQRLIIMPQALKISIPGIVSTFIGVFKDTTLVSIIGLLDPLGLSNAIRANTAWNGIVWELYGFIALMFFVFCFSMSRYSMYLERKLRTGHR